MIHVPGSNILIMSIWLIFLLETIDARKPVYEENCEYLDQCNHLVLSEVGQCNSYLSDNGFRCCMCPKGTHVYRGCSFADPNSTVCQTCIHNSLKKTYIDFEPHAEHSCFLDTTVCSKKRMKYVDGSSSSKAKCECRNGYEQFRHICTAKQKPLKPGRTQPPQTMTKTVTFVSINARKDISEITTPVSTVLATKGLYSSLTTGKNTSPQGHMLWGVLGGAAVFVFCLLIVIFLWKRKDILQKFGRCPTENVICAYQGPPVGTGEGTGKVKLVDEGNGGDSNQSLLGNANPAAEHGRTSASPLTENQDYRCLTNLNIPDNLIEEFASIITKSDLTEVGRRLLRCPRDFDDIYYSSLISERKEKARKIVWKAQELNPSLNVEDLYEAVSGFGYLANVVNKYQTADSI